MCCKRKLPILLMLAFAACGCVQMHPTRSGFLSDYREILPIDKQAERLAKSVDYSMLAVIDSFYIEPVAWLADDLGQPTSSPEDGTRIREALEKALARELGSVRPIVAKVGPHTAKVRAAITGVQDSKPLVNLLLIAQVGPLFNGGASAEIEVIGPKGEQIAAESVAYTGESWHLLGFFVRTSHAEDSVRRAASQLSNDLRSPNTVGKVKLNLDASPTPFQK